MMPGCVAVCSWRRLLSFTLALSLNPFPPQAAAPIGLSPPRVHAPFLPHPTCPRGEFQQHRDVVSTVFRDQPNPSSPARPSLRQLHVPSTVPVMGGRWDQSGNAPMRIIGISLWSCNTRINSSFCQGLRDRPPGTGCIPVSSANHFSHCLPHRCIESAHGAWRSVQGSEWSQCTSHALYHTPCTTFPAHALCYMAYITRPAPHSLRMPCVTWPYITRSAPHCPAIPRHTTPIGGAPDTHPQRPSMGLVPPAPEGHGTSTPE